MEFVAKGYEALRTFEEVPSNVTAKVNEVIELLSDERNLQKVKENLTTSEEASSYVWGNAQKVCSGTRRRRRED